METVATSCGGAFKVCSLGGGPGSELLGLARFIERERNPESFVRLEFVLIDRIQEWAETWDALAHALEDHFGDVFGDDARLWPPCGFDTDRSLWELRNNVHARAFRLELCDFRASTLSGGICRSISCDCTRCATGSIFLVCGQE